MANTPIPEYLSLPPRDYPSDDDMTNPIQPALDSLFSQFTRTQRSVSPAIRSTISRSVAQAQVDAVPAMKEQSVDLRSLDYSADYDSHLMCPICHVPFIDPVVLECDHTFCATCYDEYRQSAVSSERSQCPACRTHVLSNPKKASRLISNMCNDIQVPCPNGDCTTVVARGYMERHVVRDCLEQALQCPDIKCERQTKRKFYVPGQCIHTSHIECDCGAVIELGRGEWLKHKDEDCPNTGIQCDQCGDRVAAKDYFSSQSKHQCRASGVDAGCPGAEFGCQDQARVDDLPEHTLTCPFARLAPHLARQSRLLQSLADQLAQSKMRNEVLESSLDRLSDLVITQLQPKLAHIRFPDAGHDIDHDVEEIPRDHIPGLASVREDHGLLLSTPQHDMSPAPFLHPDTATYQHSHYQQDATASTRTRANMASQQQFLAMHDSLRSSIDTLETDLHQIHTNLTELDARSSMQIMNETLRLKEELAHTNAALFSTRGQVQWLLNRERINMNAFSVRGRQASISQQGQGVAVPTYGAEQQQQHEPFPTIQTNYTETPLSETAAAGGGFANAAAGFGGSNSSSSTSPLFGVASESGTRRPSIRRSSGGSQERVKL